MSAAGRDVLSIFGEALECASPTELQSYLDNVCGTDSKLRDRIEALLRAHVKAGEFLQGPPARPDRVATESPGTMIGSYKLGELIGEGGFGVVYMAEQQQPIRRLVALKVVKPGMDSRQVIARFEAERQALALMEHPNIAQVFDAGETSTGRPYFVMELVRGVSITDYCGQNCLTPNERLKLFASVCQAVQHAHQKGIIHRDLKPSNLLVTLNDDKPVVKVIDFGIAKAIDQRLTDKTLITGFAQVIGTPLYMSPEQAELSGLDIDTRSDIYSLGVLLYELLTGTTPFDKDRLREATFDELRRIIREEEPPKPSARVSTLGPAVATQSNQRQTDPTQLRRLLRGDLDWVVMKCLEKDRNRRYATADALARDIERYLADEPVEACPPSAGYRVRKFVRKHRRLLITSGVFLSLLLGGGALTVLQALQLAHTERDRAIQQAHRNQEVHAALGRATELRGQARSARANDLGKWAEAQAMARRAEALIETGAVEPGLAEQVDALLRELEQEEKDRRMVATLEAIRLRGGDVKNEKFDLQGNRERYREAFRQYGLDMEALSVAEAGERLRESTICEELLAALHDWWAYAVAGEVAARKLYAVANVADDNAWRRQFRVCLEKKDTTRLRELTRDTQVLQQPAPVLVTLGQVLEQAGMIDEAVAWLRKAQFHHPNDFWISSNLGLAVMNRLQPPRLDEAASHFRVALAIRPDNPGAWLNLGAALLRQGNAVPAANCFQHALELDPRYVSAHVSLGIARAGQGDLPGALDCFRRALELDPHSAQAHLSFGITRDRQGDRPGAMVSVRRALELDPNLDEAHQTLGVLLLEERDLRGAKASLDRALELNSQNGAAHYALSMVQREQGDLRGAEASCRRAVELDESFSEAHYDLGRYAQDRGDWSAAAAHYRHALVGQPQNAEAHCNLGLVLLEQSDLRTALAELQTGHKLGSQNREWRYPSARWLKECQRFLELEARLPLLLKEDAKLANSAEHFELAKLCKYKKLYVSAARFCTEAFAVDASLAGNFRAGPHYLAATSAALAGSGQGEEAARLTEAERGRLRGQALEWLHPLLTWHGTLLKDGKPSGRQQAQTALYLWQNDPALVGVRDADALAKLPADERSSWQQFWADIADLQEKAREQK